jgi:uncharacterized protein (TIRG00374 family)
VKKSLARWIRPLLGLFVTFFFLWLLGRKVDFAVVKVILSRISLVSVLIALTFLAAGYSMRIVRWWWMLRTFDPQIRTRACGWPFLVSIGLNNLLPFRAGDIVRVFGFHEELRLPAMQLMGTLVIERLFDLMTLLTFFFFGLLGITHNKMSETFINLAIWIGAAGVIVVFTVLFFSDTIERFIFWIAEYPFFIKHGWSDHIKRHSRHFLEALGLMRSPRLTLQLLTLSILVWVFEGAVFATVAHGLSVTTIAGPWFALSTGTLGTLLPSSPGYVGTFDYLAMVGLIAYGADRDHAAAFAFIVHVVLWLPLTMIGITYFLKPSARVLRQRVTAAISAAKEQQ